MLSTEAQCYSKNGTHSRVTQPLDVPILHKLITNMQKLKKHFWNEAAEAPEDILKWGNPPELKSTHCIRLQRWVTTRRLHSDLAEHIGTHIA